MRYNNDQRRFSLKSKRNKLVLLQDGQVPKQHEVMALLNIYESLIFHLSLMGHTKNNGVFKAFDLTTYLKSIGESEQPSTGALRYFCSLVLAPFVDIYSDELKLARQSAERLSFDPDTEKPRKKE